ncbi:MAG TPA: response regulator [Candidatus Dormibacteraeota bacterium]|nr:response regulator [Candidatus Dormibacteraeota bacterium]
MRPSRELRRRALLLVEDDPIIAQMYVLGLETAGYDVTCVHDAHDALRALGTRVPDAAILDWELPGMRGDELYEAVRANVATRHLPLMFLSNHRPSESKIAGAVMGGDAIPWLVKADTPPAELSARVADLLASVTRRPTSPSAA